MDSVDLELSAGGFLGIVGESGSGKSTLLFAIAQLLSPPAQIVGGEVHFHGSDLVTLGQGRLATSAGRELLGRHAERYERPQPGQVAGRTNARCLSGAQPDVAPGVAVRSAEVLRMVGIDPVHLRSYPHQLSGGMRQRSMIAMALLFEPQLVIMDEPTSSLDVVAQRSLMIQIKRLQERLGFAVLFVTHDMSLVGGIADRLAVMYGGKLVEFGPTQEIFAKPLHPYTAGLLEAFPSIQEVRRRLTGIPGSPPDLRQRIAGCRFATRCRKPLATVPLSTHPRS